MSSRLDPGLEALPKRGLTEIKKKRGLTLWAFYSNFQRVTGLTEIKKKRGLIHFTRLNNNLLFSKRLHGISATPGVRFSTCSMLKCWC
jgi:hypothetical protein